MDIVLRLLIAGGIMGILDFLWLGFVAKKIYHHELGNMLLEKPFMPPAIAFYIIYVIGVVLFVVNPALEKTSWQHAVGYGALFGLIAYATYDLTNWATIKGWSPKIVVIDLAWGAALTGCAALLTYLIVKEWIN